MTVPIATLSYLANIAGFVIALPMMAATWYQSFRARQEIRRARENVIHSADCLEFVTADGACINLIPLETLRALPRPGIPAGLHLTACRLELASPLERSAPCTLNSAPCTLPLCPGDFS